MLLLPTTITTGNRWRTKESTSINEKPAAPSPSNSTICADGCAMRAAIPNITGMNANAASAMA